MGLVHDCYFFYSHIYHIYLVSHVKDTFPSICDGQKVFWAEAVCPSEVHPLYRWGHMFLNGCSKFIHQKDKSGCLKWLVVHVLCAHCASQTSHNVHLTQDKHHIQYSECAFWYWLYTKSFSWRVGELLLPISLIQNHHIWSWLRLIACLLK